MSIKSKIFAACVCVIVLMASVVAAVAQTAESANRFLFVIETSRAMKPRMAATAQSVQELLGAGIAGQLRTGDTIGLWTYDSELHAGVFPMIVWSDKNRFAPTQAVGEYLAKHKLSGRAKISVVLPEMLRLLEESQALTVLWYSDGTQPIEGTPFDESINAAFKDHVAELRAAKLPFVTVLIGRSGQVVKCAMNSSVGVSIPALPLPEEPAKPEAITNAAVAATALPQPPRPVKTNAPLVVDYSKARSNETMLGGGRLREHFSGTPMAKDGGPKRDGSSAPANAAAAFETNMPQEAVALPATMLTSISINVPATVAVEVTSASPPMAAVTNTPPPAATLPNPPPMAVVKTSLPPLIVVYSLTNEPPANEPTTTASIPAKPSSKVLIAFAVGALLLAAGILVWWWRNVTRPKAKGSLITESYNHQNK